MGGVRNVAVGIPGGGVEGETRRSDRREVYVRNPQVVDDVARPDVVQVPFGVRSRTDAREVYVQGAQQVGVGSRVDAPGDIAGDGCRALASAMRRLQQRRAQADDSCVDTGVGGVCGSDVRWDLGGPGCQIPVHVQHLEGRDRAHAVPRRYPEGGSQGETVDEGRGKEAAVDVGADGFRDRTGGCGQEDCTAVDRPVKLLPRPRGNESRQFLTVGERDDAGVIGVRQVRGRIQIRDCFVRGWLAGERRGHSCSWNVEDSVFRAHSRARAASQNTPCDWRGGRIRGGGIRERIGTSH